MIEALKIEERQRIHDSVWADPALHRFEWALMCYFPSKSNGETGWQPKLQELLGQRGEDWELGSYIGSVRLATEYTADSVIDDYMNPRQQRTVVVYCDHTLDSLKVIAKLKTGSADFSWSFVLGFRSPSNLNGDPWQDHLLASPIQTHVTWI